MTATDFWREGAGALREFPLKRRYLLLLACGSIASMHSAAAEPPPLSDPGQAPVETSSAGSDWAAMKAQAEAESAAFTAAKAAADAKKAMIEAEAAAAKAKYGGLSAMSGTPGAVEASTDAGKAEAMLLVTRATQQASDRLASELTASFASTPYRDRELLILTSLDELSASDAIQFDAQTALMRTLMDAAKATCENALAASRQGGAASSQSFRSLLPVLGAVLDSGAKIASYFQTDYKFAGLVPAEPTNLTAAAVAASLRRAEPNRRVLVPANVLTVDAQPVLDVMSPLQAQYADLVALAAETKSRSAQLKAKSPELAARLDAAEAQANKAVTLFEGFSSALIVPKEAKAAPPIASVLRQKKLQASMARKPLVLLVTSSKAGALYTKKNMWTFLAGSPPLYTMGGVSLAYSVFDPADGVILASGAIPVHGGYRSVGAAERLFGVR